MDLGFGKDQVLLRQSVAEFLSKECPYDRVKEIEEKEVGYSPELWEKIAALGWLGVPFPESYGGYEDPFLNLIIIMEEIGKAAFPSPFLSTIIQCGMTILEGGSAQQKNDLLRQMIEGRLIMAMAQYEEEGSYLASGIKMVAAFQGDHYLLNGTKMFVNDANIADKLIVAAQAGDAGITLFLVDGKDSGITCEKMYAIAMDNTCHVVFQDVKVPPSNIIGKPGNGWQILEKVNEKATVAKCAEMLGGCKACIDLTTAYAKKRVAYGKPIGSYQVIQHYLANMLISYDPTVNFLYKVAWMIDEGLDATKEVSALKAWVNDQYKFISERAVQIHGAIGTTRELDVGLFFRRAKSFEYMLGDIDYHYERVSQALGL
ncbi:acyl-CoA dehydrogenase family protein [Thermodesulfobacteriota bacterium]